MFGDQSAALECTVQDISASGANIAFAASDKLPLEFVLEVLALDLRVKARLVRSQGKCHRVEFHWAQKQGGCEDAGARFGFIQAIWSNRPSGGKRNLVRQTIGGICAQTRPSS